MPQAIKKAKDSIHISNSESDIKLNQNSSLPKDLSLLLLRLIRGNSYQSHLYFLSDPLSSDDYVLCLLLNTPSLGTKSMLKLSWQSRTLIYDVAFYFTFHNILSIHKLNIKSI